MSDLNNLEDFVRLTFLHLACVDGSLHPNERDTIIEKMTEFFPEVTGHEEKLAAAESEYKKLGNTAVEELLTHSWWQHASLDPALKQKLFANLFDIINSDARVNEEETRVLRIMKKWLLPED
ncbi:MAG TPA: hypothetical protein PLR06_04765 [Cyclobacteriaceae bacterium]|nr:hypothetical protein [Cyclobacteriaceae bacterium]